MNLTHTEAAQIKTLATKQGIEWTNDLGQSFPAATLYRFEDGNGQGGCWFNSVDRAEASWELYITGAARRDRRAAENDRYRAAVAAHDAREASDDPFARLGA